MAITIAAGLLLYRINQGKPEVFLVHPGGPYMRDKDNHAWSFPKGKAENGEDLLVAAQREFVEETGFVIPVGHYIYLGEVSRPGKIVHVWAIEGDCDPSLLKSNTCMIEWPPRSGKNIEIPEVDRGDFFDLSTARTKLFAYLQPAIDLFEQKMKIYI